MTVAATTLGMLYGTYGATVTSATTEAMNGALMAGFTYGEAGLTAAPVEAQLLNLSYADAGGTTMFDVLGAYYGASSDLAAMLGAYSAALQQAG